MGKAHILIANDYYKQFSPRNKASPIGEAVNGVKPLTEEDNFNNLQSLLKSRVLSIGFFILSRLLLVPLVKSTLPEGEKLIIDYARLEPSAAFNDKKHKFAAPYFLLKKVTFLSFG